ncbi:MAG: hypothetical protein RXR43_11650 [Sulfolobus sp.]
METKPITISFNTRNTGMGGYDDVILISLKSGKVIKSRLSLTKTGSHGTRSYALLPAKYLMYAVSRSNLGNLYITVKIVKIDSNGVIELEKWDLYERKELKMVVSQLPENIAKMLLNNKDSLPFFNYVSPE